MAKYTYIDRRLFAYLSPRRKHFVIETYDQDRQVHRLPGSYI
jgi:hypothetical protein